jgi:formylglycine-generating enzyme required for sulfatase activity
MGRNPSSFTGPNLPVETITWFDAVQYCNAHSIVDGLTPAYTMTDATYDGDHISSATVTWNQAANGWRLLTEAEWEYACRAGSTAAFCNGGISQCHCESEPTLTQVGWFCGNSGDTTHDVGTRSPNAWGLYDMHGNVWELCWDRYEYYGGSETDPTGPPSGSLGVIRGGSWSNDAPGCRSAVRSYVPPGSRYFNLGLRLARTVF